MPSAQFRILLLLSVSVIAACSHKSPVTPARPAYSGPGEIADIRSHPQDLNAYVGSNPQRRIIDMSSRRPRAGARSSSAPGTRTHRPCAKAKCRPC